MRRRSVLGVLALVTFFVLAAACGSTEEGPAGATRANETVSPGDSIDYEGPETPKDTEWLLRSLEGHDVAKSSGILLFHDKQELGVEGGCMGFYLVHELEADRIRVVRPGLQVGRLECGKPEEVRRQAEAILSIVRDLAQVRAEEDVFELRSESGEVAAFVPPAPAQVDPTLAGTEWTVTSVNGHEPPSGPPSTLEIEAEDLVGFGPCNGFGGAIDRMSNGEIEWSSQSNEGFSSTTVGCGGPDARHEREYMDALAGAESYRLEGDRLELRDAEGRPTVVLRQKLRSDFDPAVLENTRWRVRAVDGEEPLEGSVPTIQFGSGNEVTWYDGCQGYRGTYEKTDYGVAMHRRGASPDACVKPETYTHPEGPCVRVCFSPDGLYRMRDGLLEIVSEMQGTTTVLEPLAEDAALNRDGTPWQFRGFVEGGEKTPVRGDAPITLTFDHGTLRMGGEGTMFGSTGCNDYRVAYEYPITRNGPDRLIVGDPSVSKRKCAGPPGVFGQEQRFLGILGDVAFYPDIRIDGRMTLETEDNRQLVFAAPE